MVYPRMLLYFFVMIAFFLGSSTLSFAEAGKDVVAKVGNINISDLEVQREMQKMIPLQVSYHGGVKPEKIEEIRQQALQAMIERAYKVQYAVDEEIAVAPNLLEQEWQAFLAKNSAGIKNASAEQLNSHRADMYLNLLAKQAETEAVDNLVDVSEATVKAYYEENQQSYHQPKLYTASQIFVRVDPASNKTELEELQLRAETLLKRASSGEDFYNLAYYESDDRSKYVGGSLGSFHAGQTVKEFDEALKEMKAGEISGLVRTMYGYHIIKMDDVKDSRQLTYEEASIGINKKLKQDARAELYEQWMQQNRDKYRLQNVAN